MATLEEVVAGAVGGHRAPGAVVAVSGPTGVSVVAAGGADPGALYAGGSLVPLGGREGHKGYCLGLAVDVLGGLLSRAGAGGLNPRHGDGCPCLVLAPRAFAAEEGFLARPGGQLTDR